MIPRKQLAATSPFIPSASPAWVIPKSRNKSPADKNSRPGQSIDTAPFVSRDSGTNRIAMSIAMAPTVTFTKNRPRNQTQPRYATIYPDRQTVLARRKCAHDDRKRAGRHNSCSDTLHDTKDNQGGNVWSQATGQ